MAGIQGFIGIEGPVQTTPSNNPSTFKIETISIATPGTPQQFTATTIPPGSVAVVRADPNNSGGDRIFVANSAANTAIAGSRIELRRGESVTLKVASSSNIHIDANNAGAQATLFVEQA